MTAKNTLSTPPHAFVIVAIGILLLACAVPVAQSRMIHSVTAPGVKGEIRAEPTCPT